jgi:tRNA U34 5-methylaminomethyl-2-thiouridine-forming methyltransferase MnmC
MAQDRKEIRILELGFGTGLNALLTAQESVKCRIQTSYTGIDISFLPKEIFETLNFPYCMDSKEENLDLFTRIYSSELGSFIKIDPYFQLMKIQTDWFEYKGDSRFNLIYFDAFAPDTQPELWSCDSLSKCAELLEPGGVLVTYCAKGQVKRNLRAAGFDVTALPGPPGKREVTRAVKT